MDKEMRCAQAEAGGCLHADAAEAAAQLVALMRRRGLTLGTAESLTAGMIAARVADVSGASAVLMGGVVAYDPRVKRDVLGVDQRVIDTVGVVSRECALQMAQGARRVLGVDVAVSATGVAGPTGGTPDTPVGTVYLAVCSDALTRVDECHFTGDRQSVRLQSVQHALGMALQAAQAG